MQKLLSLVTVILVSGLVGVESLQCYVCYNCTNPTEADVRTCGVPETTVPPQTTPTSPQTVPATSEITSAPAESTPTSLETTPTPADTTPVEVPTPGPQVHRSKRNALTPPTKTNNDGCSCKNEPGCECAIDVFSNRISQYADESYLCYRITGQDNGVEIIARGCVPSLMGGVAPCDADLGPLIESCSTCDTDRCNGSFAIQYSVFLLAAAIGLMLLK